MFERTSSSLLPKIVMSVAVTDVIRNRRRGGVMKLSQDMTPANV